MNISAGGVENGGNTCSLSVLLQEFAALPEVYEPFFTAPLKWNPTGFRDDRESLQENICASVKKLREGASVHKQEVYEMTSILYDLGWQNDSIWSLLHLLVPRIFSWPLSNPHDLYDKVISVLSDENMDYPYKIVLLAQGADYSVKTTLKKSSSVADTAKNILFRIAEDPENELGIEDNFEIGQRTFCLKLVLALERTWGGNHFVLYRKINDLWNRFSDLEVGPAKNLPTINICTLIYTSHSF